MQLKRFVRVALLLPCIVLASCSSPSYKERVHDAVSNMSQAIQMFNSSEGTDLATVSAACRQAEQDLQNGTASLDDPHPPAHYRKVVTLLRSARQAALQGFADCARAASTLDYSLMVQADHEIAAANGWITTSRRFDR